MNKTFIVLCCIFVLSCILLAGCGSGDPENIAPADSPPDDAASDSIAQIEPEEIPLAVDPAPLPTLTIGYMFSNHQASLIIAAAMGDRFEPHGVYLREVLPRERYVLVSGTEDIANINVIVANNGGEIMTMMSQGNVDLALTSIGLPLSQIDQGAEMKVLGPIHVDGVALIGNNDLPADDFDSFIAFVREQDRPVKVGYHSPANAPVIIFEESVRTLGLSITEDPGDFSADILLVNLRGTANLIPALLSGEVDAWVGPSPFPELAILQGDGKLIVDLKYLPGGSWTDFPCCVFSATDEALAEHRDIITRFYKLLTIASDFANAEKDAAGEIVSAWMGVDIEAAKNTMTIFTTDVSQNWLDHSMLIYRVLQDNGTLEGSFADMDFTEAMPEIFDLSIAEQVR